MTLESLKSTQAKIIAAVMIKTNIVLFAFLTVASLHAQSKLTPDTLPDPVAVTKSATKSSITDQTFSLGLKWNETARHFSVPLINSGAQPLKVLGVQASPGLYLTNFPKNVAPGASSDITVLFVDEAGASSGTDFLKVLTSDGTKIIAINHDRAPVVQFDQSSLTWAQGDAVAAKSVIITVSGGVTKPIGVKALNAGHKAILTDLGNGKWSVAVTPSSTKSATRFPVKVEFSPALPGVPGLIICDVAPIDL